jgi:hypothetical protein
MVNDPDEPRIRSSIQLCSHRRSGRRLEYLTQSRTVAPGEVQPHMAGSGVDTPSARLVTPLERHGDTEQHGQNKYHDDGEDNARTAGERQLHD